ncbi:CRISPR-associated protein Cas4 [Desulfofalx alkaliphila]|uniref:CRISPR-associated protein Cas4 n=1 Tax=Desulfofalx alkaliphila TaxID=105483 RepID=UPI0004E24EF0|nr:CRISPR-associated protein Cas4 [Desulfofalx alkaliphila]
MIYKYKDEDLLALSGIQHFAYCPRQWALIHIEKQWIENLHTVEGKQLHERVDNPDFFESRGGVLTARSVPISSYELGFFGVADLVEFYADEKKGITLNGRQGKWRPIPVEYKKGKPKKDIIDQVQLCAQAICLEEMLSTTIEYGYLFYGKTKHRTKIVFGKQLRDEVVRLAEQMHSVFNKQITPKPLTNNKGCKSCSLVNVCLPKLGTKQAGVNSYIKRYLGRE